MALKYGQVLHLSLFDAGVGDGDGDGDGDQVLAQPPPLSLLSFTHCLAEGPEGEAVLSPHDLPECIKLARQKEEGQAGAASPASTTGSDVLTENSPVVLETMDGSRVLALEVRDAKRNTYTVRWNEVDAESSASAAAAAAVGRQVWCLQQGVGKSCNGPLQYGVPSQLLAVLPSGQLLAACLVGRDDGTLGLAVQPQKADGTPMLWLIAEPLEEDEAGGFAAEAGDDLESALPQQHEGGDEVGAAGSENDDGVWESAESPQVKEESDSAELGSTMPLPSSTVATPAQDMEHSDRAVFVLASKGPLGATLKRSPEGRVHIGSIASGGQAETAGIREGDEIVEVAGWAIAENGISQEAWPHLLGHIKSAERPLTIILERPDSSDLMSSSIHSTDESKVSRVLQSLARVKFPAPKSTESPLASPRSARELADGTRDFVKSGQVKTFSAGTLWSSYRDTQILLFTDLLLVAPLLRNSQPTYEASIGLSAAKLRVFRANAGDEGKVPHRLEVISPAVTYAFCFSAAQERDEWAIALATQLLSLENPDCSSQSNSRLEDWATESVKHAMDVHRVVMGTLHSAALRGDTSEVSSLLAAGAPSDALDSQGLSALDYAVRASQVGAVKLLLAAGSAIDCVDESGRNLLHIASMSLSEGVLKALLESPGAGPLVNSRDEAGFTPAHAATVSACNGDMRDVPELSMYESPPPLTGCLLALRCAGADLDFPAADGLSSLHRSAMLWRCGVVESLCACGADPDGALPDTSPLHLACSGSRRAAAASLMSSSSFQKLDDSGSTLQYSSNGSSGSDVAEKVTKSHSKQADYNLPGTVKALLQWGASPNLPDGAGVVPMEYLVGPWLAEEEGRREVTEGAGDTSPATPHAISGGIGASRIAAAIVLAKFGARIPENVAAAAERLIGSSSAMALETAATDRAAQPALKSADLVVRRLWKESEWMDEPRCSCCLALFTLFRRQHHCRFCGKPVCNACSLKTATVQGERHRACDGCYNRLSRLAGIIRKGYCPHLPHWDAQRKGYCVATESDRQQLFSGASPGSGPLPSPQQQNKGKAAEVGGMQALQASLKGVQEGLLQRGEVLGNLADKSDALKESASQFEQVARALSQQQQNSWF